MTPLVFRKSAVTVLVNSTSSKCHRTKLAKKSLLLAAAGYHPMQSSWYIPHVGAQFFQHALHRALQDTEASYIGPRLARSPRGGSFPAAEFGTPDFLLLWSSCLQSPQQPFSQRKALHLQEAATQQQFFQQAVVSVLNQISRAQPLELNLHCPTVKHKQNTKRVKVEGWKGTCWKNWILPFESVTPVMNVTCSLGNALPWSQGLWI